MRSRDQLQHVAVLLSRTAWRQVVGSLRVGGGRGRTVVHEAACGSAAALHQLLGQRADAAADAGVVEVQGDERNRSWSLRALERP